VRSATVTLREILVRLKQTYCSTIGVEYMHIPDRHECNWIRCAALLIPPPPTVLYRAALPVVSADQQGVHRRR
jgi:hypothetical protein